MDGCQGLTPGTPEEDQRWERSEGEEMGIQVGIGGRGAGRAASYSTTNLQVPILDLSFPICNQEAKL